MALFFGGFDGVHFFNDLKGIWPIRAQDSVVMTERRNVVSDEQIEVGVKAPEMREPSSGSGFWKTFVNPYPSGWILEPQPEVEDDLRQRRAQVFDTNWFVTQNDFKTCNESFTYVVFEFSSPSNALQRSNVHLIMKQHHSNANTQKSLYHKRITRTAKYENSNTNRYFDEDTEEIKLKHGAEQYCLGKIALPWRGVRVVRELFGETFKQFPFLNVFSVMSLE